MKKVMSFFKRSSFYPVIALGIFYLFWLVSVPIDEPIIMGLILYAIFVAVIILLKLLSNNPILFSLLLVVALLILSANILYSLNYYPRTIDTAEFGDFKYFIVSTRDSDSHVFMLFYKCNKWGFNCNSLYGSYSWEKTLHIFIDQANNEVSILQGEPLPRFIYTDGKNPRTYLYTGERLGDYLYFVSEDWSLQEGCNSEEYWNCDTYTTYTLFRCKLDYTSCHPLPIQYTIDYENFAYLEADEITNEVNLYDSDDDTLIFTYGKHPRCYVKGCVILEQK